MPEHVSKAAPATLGGGGGGSVFGHRRADIFARLQQSAENCRLAFSGRTELATEQDENVAALCEALEDAFSYGLRQPQATTAAAVALTVSLFQNMQEIVTGSSSSSSTSASNGFASSDTCFWDFCQLHLTAHERERYNELKHVWTKCGRGRAFIRATLNEHSLQRYLLTWLNSSDDDNEALSRHYTHWSLFYDKEASEQLPRIVGSLNQILFALTVDTTELNAPTRRSESGGGGSGAAPPKEEPIIFAPTPVPVASAAHRQKRKTNAVERPIATSNSTEDLLGALLQQEAIPRRPGSTPPKAASLVHGTEEVFAAAAAKIDLPPPPLPPDPIEPELEFLKQPLPDLYTAEHVSNGEGGSGAAADHEYDDKSDDSSSQYSKASSAATANQAALEAKLHDVSERCALLETRVAQLSLENRLLVRRLTQHFNESGIDPSSSLSANFLITIPLVKLLKSPTGGGSSYYAYEVHITMRRNLEHWSLLCRYREFYKLHRSLLRTHPSIGGAVEFPPKKHFGNMNLVFVEERRQQLQIYLLNLVESLPQVEACKTRAELQKVFPFFRER